MSYLVLCFITDDNKKGPVLLFHSTFDQCPDSFIQFFTNHFLVFFISTRCVNFEKHVPVEHELKADDSHAVIAIEGAVAISQRRIFKKFKF